MSFASPSANAVAPARTGTVLRCVCAASRPIVQQKPHRAIAPGAGSTTRWIARQLESEQLESTPSQRFLVVGSFGLNLAILSSALSHVDSWSSALAVFAASFSGYLAADFLSGVYHWAIDNYGDEETPIVGAQIHSFQRHHQYPWTITYREFCNKVHAICFPAIPFSAALMLASPPDAVSVFGAVGCMFVVLSQQLHSWSHSKRSELPTVVRVLQDRGLFVSTKVHCQHHRSPFNVNYAIVSGISNPLLNRSLPSLETWIRDRTGVAPRSWTEASSEDIEYFV